MVGSKWRQSSCSPRPAGATRSMSTSGCRKIWHQVIFVVQVWLSEDSLQCCRHCLHCETGRQVWGLWLRRFSQDLLICLSACIYSIQVLFLSRQSLQDWLTFTILTIFSRPLDMLITWICTYFFPHHHHMFISSFLKIYWCHHPMICVAHHRTSTQIVNIFIVSQILNCLQICPCLYMPLL